MRLEVPAFVASLLLLASPLGASERRYVVCDNGLRCVTAPCPSSTALDLATGEMFKGVRPDISELAEADQRRIQDTDALYYGRLVLRGHLSDRDLPLAGKSVTLPSLVVTGIERAATSDERRFCPAD